MLTTLSVLMLVNNRSLIWVQVWLDSANISHLDANWSLATKASSNCSGELELSKWNMTWGRIISHSGELHTVHFSSVMEYLSSFSSMLTSEGSNIYSTTIKTHIKGAFFLLWGFWSWLLIFYYLSRTLKSSSACGPTPTLTDRLTSQGRF